jgi:hypothetical protein
MSLEPIGIVVAIFGIVAIALGLKAGAYILCLCAILGSAAAILLPAAGGASIQPFHFVLLFLAAAVAVRPKTMSASLSVLAYPGPGFWYALFILYSVLTALFLPRIFNGATIVYGFSGGGHHGIVVSPLAPATSNVTQAFYMLGSLVCFAIVGGYSRMGGGVTFTRALVIAGGMTIFFAIADVVTYLTNTAFLLAPIRNAGYRMLDDGDVEGFKRIVGSYTEAGAYGYFALALFSFLLILSLEGFRARLLGTITTALAITLLLCTSTTAYVATGITVLLVLAFCLVRVLRHRATSRHLLYVIGCLLVVPLLVLTAMLIPVVWDNITNLVHATMTTKLESQSGEERMRWNNQALATFFDTAGMGAGLGSTRASSFLIALLATVGLPGTILCFIFFGSLTRSVLQRPSSEGFESKIGLAALLSCISQFTAASIAAGAIDLGPIFSIMAGLAAGYSMGPRQSPAAIGRNDGRWRAMISPLPISPSTLQSTIPLTIDQSSGLAARGAEAIHV